MKRFLLSTILRRDLVAAALLAGSIVISFAGDDDITATEANISKNLAGIAAGAEIECTTPDGRVIEVGSAANQTESVAFLDNDTLKCVLQEGRTSFVIKLPSASLLDRFTFVNQDAAAAGDLKISVSNYRLPAASDKWTAVDGRTAFSHKRRFSLSMLGVEARYVKLDFTVEKPGRIAALGLFGAEPLDSSTDGVMQVSNNGGRSLMEELGFDFANIYARGRVVYVSSGGLTTAARMNDNNITTSFEFAPNDSRPTVIVELAHTEILHRVTANYSTRKGRLEIYTLNELRADRSDLRGGKLIASIVDEKRDGKTAVDFDPQGARYVAWRWTPEDVANTTPFEVADVKAFGDAPLAMLNFAALPDTYAATNTVATSMNAPSLAGDVPLLPQVPAVSP